MTIDEAVKVSEDILPKIHHGNTQYEYEAIKLGIEALKYYQQVRTGPYATYIPLLLGETEYEKSTYNRRGVL